MIYSEKKWEKVEKTRKNSKKPEKTRKNKKKKHEKSDLNGSPRADIGVRICGEMVETTKKGFFRVYLMKKVGKSEKF